MKVIGIKDSTRDLTGDSVGEGLLLDVGCGSGEFLQLARGLGFEAEGLEIDPLARSAALQRGNVVHFGGLPGSNLRRNSYRHVMLNHVVEHLHYPRAALAEAYNLLEPGGRIWIQVPNALGNSILLFGSDSRLLEPPRHLVMFGPDSLASLLRDVGFVDISTEPMRYEPHNAWLMRQSWLIRNGADPYTTELVDIPPEYSAGADIGRYPNKSEIFNAIGRKPD